MYYIVKVVRTVSAKRREGSYSKDCFEVLGESKTLEEAKIVARANAPREFSRDTDEIIICKSVAEVHPVIDVMVYEEKITPELLTEEGKQ